MNNKGFGAVEVILILVIVGILGFVGYRAYTVYTEDQETGSEQNKYELKEDDGLTEYENEKLGINFAYPEEWGEIKEKDLVGSVSEQNDTIYGTNISFSAYKDSEIGLNLYTKRLPGGGTGCTSTIECVSLDEEVINKNVYRFTQDGSNTTIFMVDGTVIDGQKLGGTRQIVSSSESTVLFRSNYNYTLEGLVAENDEEITGVQDSELDSEFSRYEKEAHNQHHFVVMNAKEKAVFIGGNAYFTPEGSVEKKLIDQFIALAKSLKID